MMKKIFYSLFILSVFVFGNIKVSAQTTNEPGAGNCLQFNGTTDFVEIPANYNFGTTDFTFSLWTRVSNGDVGVLGNYRNIPASRGWGLFYGAAPSRVNVFAYGDIGTLDIAFPYNVLDDNWHYISGVYQRTGNSVTINIYADGLLIGGSTGIVGDISSNSNFKIGRYIAQPFFPGQIDEVRIWNYALTQTEIKQNMCSKLPDCANPNLVGYWRFDEGTDNTCSGGQDVCDASCNGNHGVKY